LRFSHFIEKYKEGHCYNIVDRLVSGDHQQNNKNQQSRAQQIQTSATELFHLCLVGTGRVGDTHNLPSSSSEPLALRTTLFFFN